MVWMAEGAGGWIEGDGRHHDVDMRVVLHGPAPGMKDGGEAEASSEFGLREVLHGAGTLAQEKIVEDAGVLFAERPEGVRDGEGDLS